MVNLIAKTPCEGLLPLSHGGVELAEAAPDRVTSVMPYVGRDGAASEQLSQAHGLSFPAPGRVSEAGGMRAIWSGAGQALVLGGEVEASLAQSAALTDQSDGWAVLRLSGEGVEDVMARLTPIDLNAAVFKPGHTARSLIAHANAVITRLERDCFELMVMRSMAAWVVHEVAGAMQRAAAKAALET